MPDQFSDRRYGAPVLTRPVDRCAELDDKCLCIADVNFHRRYNANRRIVTRVEVTFRQVGREDEFVR